VVGCIAARFLREEKEEHPEVEMRELGAGDVTDAEKLEGETFVVRARRREGVRRNGLFKGHSGSL
jgi:phage FluMu protein gp41